MKIKYLMQVHSILLTNTVPQTILLSQHQKSGKIQDLSDLLDTHQDRPTEVRHRDQVKIITTPWTRNTDAAEQDA